MRAKKVMISAKGGPEVVKVVEYEVPEPEEHEVRIKVEYAGLAFADLMLRKRGMPGLPKIPVTPGADCTGVIEKVGNDVSGLNPGDRVTVLFMSDFGGQAQYVCVHESRVKIVPDEIPLDKAVCLVVNYLTAYKMLSKYLKLTEQEKPDILVHGGSGGVGSALIQIAVSHGIDVISTASTSNVDMLQEMGAIGIDYNNSDFVDVITRTYPEKMDAVFDPVGGDYLARSLKILKKGGCYIGYGFQNDLKGGMFGIMKTMVRFGLRKLITFDKKLAIFQLGDENHSDCMNDLKALFDMYAAGKINPVISEVIPMADASKAHRNLENGKRRGKIIIRAVDA